MFSRPEYPGNLMIAFTMLFNPVFASSHCQPEVVDAISLRAVSCKNSLCVGARVSLRLLLRFCRQLMYRLRTMQGLLYTALMQEHESSVLLHKKHTIEVMLVPLGVAEARLFKHLSITLSISTI